MWFECSVRWRSRLTLRALRSTWPNAGAVEDGWLLRHLSENARSLFGLTHRFSEISTVSGFRSTVPVRTLAEAQRDAAELRMGLRRGLTVRSPACLAVSQDGELPLATESQRDGARLWQLWAASVEQAHPGALAGHLAWSRREPPASTSARAASRCWPVSSQSPGCRAGSARCRRASPRCATPCCARSSPPG